MEFNHFGQSEGTPGSRIAQELQHLKMSEDVCLRRSKFLEVPIKEKLQSRWLWLQFYKWRKKRWKWCVSFHFALNYLLSKQMSINSLTSSLNHLEMLVAFWCLLLLVPLVLLSTWNILKYGRCLASVDQSLVGNLGVVGGMTEGWLTAWQVKHLCLEFMEWSCVTSNLSL